MSDKVFVSKKEETTRVLYPIISSLRNRGIEKGEIGLEIECEGNKFPKADTYNYGSEANLPKHWLYHKDGSLRGNDNAEYVIKGTIKFSEAEKHLKALWKALDTYGTKLDDSNRTSVHVHLNCQMFHANRLASLMCMYIAVEELLTAWCGEHRVGNLFCLRAVDAPGIVETLCRYFRTYGGMTIPDGIHYAGMNAQSLQKYGSLEFRSLRGCSDYETILKWVGILQHLYEKSADIKDPRDVIAAFSYEGPLAFIDTILGEKALTVINEIGYNAEQVQDALFRGIRLAQDLAYCLDWSSLQYRDYSPDPFGRGRKRLSGFSEIIGNPENDSLSEYQTMPSAATTIYNQILTSSQNFAPAEPEMPDWGN